jgi:predicted methyltransferase
MTSIRLRPTIAALVLAFVPASATAQQSGSALPPAKIFEAIGVKEGITVCEIGAGDGELAIEAARLVGPQGRIYASELGEERVKKLQEKVAATELAQITVVTGDPVKTNFPDATCDALFMRNVYHHFADPTAMNASILAALKPGARYAVVDFTPPDKEAPTPADRSKDGMHGVKPDTVAAEMKSAGFEPVSSDMGSNRWFMVVSAKASQDGGSGRGFRTKVQDGGSARRFRTGVQNEGSRRRFRTGVQNGGSRRTFGTFGPWLSAEPQLSMMREAPTDAGTCA